MKFEKLFMGFVVFSLAAILICVSYNCQRKTKIMTQLCAKLDQQYDSWTEQCFPRWVKL
jgi:hypothetical protein